MAFSLAQQKALVILPKISGFASLIGSVLIVWIVVKDKNKRSATYHRLICGSSLINIFSSFWAALSTWPMPLGSRLWAVGNTRTCTAQGFFVSLSIGSAVYNASLSPYYQLTIINGWKQDRMQKIEPYFHAIPIVWSFGLGITNLALTNFNPSLSWCGAAEYPLGCKGSDCIRGEHADAFTWLFYSSLWLSILLITVCVTCIFLYVLKIEKRSEAYRFRIRKQTNETNSASNDNPTDAVETSQQGRRRDIHFKRTKQMAHQCFLYAGAFYLTWIPVTVARILIAVTGEVRFPASLVAVITAPLQGLPTFVVYLGPKFRKQMREHPTAGICGWCKTSFDAATTLVSSRSHVQSVETESEPT